MCGLVGVISNDNVFEVVYNGLSLLQHRGQDAAGIAAFDGNFFNIHKGKGRISEIFTDEIVQSINGNIGIGHVRYPTAGTTSVNESQPFYASHPYGIVFAHNGTINNAKKLLEDMYNFDRRHINTHSDSEVLMNIFANGVSEDAPKKPTPECAFRGAKHVFEKCVGAYACVAIVRGLGLVAFRDTHGIRPLIFGEKIVDGKTEYMVASESVSLDINGYKIIRDVKPGECIVFKENGAYETFVEKDKKYENAPCLFEYLYFARPDSIIDNVLVYDYRVASGKKLAKKIQSEWGGIEFDSVIPIPETGRISALEIAKTLKIPYREGFVKNFYVGRTFIMGSKRANSVRMKLNPIKNEFKDKNILIVDDSIVRGTTSREIIKIVKELGAKSVYIASVSDKVKYQNVYGIDMPCKKDLIAHIYKDENQIAQSLGVDGVIYLDLKDMKDALNEAGGNFNVFEDSVFTGNYITGNIEQDYLENLEKLGNK